jgi:hypothetical protein
MKSYCVTGATFVYDWGVVMVAASGWAVMTAVSAVGAENQSPTLLYAISTLAEAVV